MRKRGGGTVHDIVNINHSVIMAILALLHNTNIHVQQQPHTLKHNNTYV